MPRGDLLLEAPPEIPPPQGKANFGMILRMLPMVAGAGAMAMMMMSNSGSRGPLGAVMGGLFGVSMLGMMLTQTGRGNDDQAQELDAARRDYFRYLGQLRTRIRNTADEQRRATLWIHPDPAGLWTIPGSRRMWERRATEDDFGSIRIGLGMQNFVQRITPPESKPVEDLEPLTVGALRRFMSTHRRVRSMPISLDVPSYHTITLLGDDGPGGGSARQLAYAMVAQLATWHAPTDLRLLICCSAENVQWWDWAKWLPHLQHPERTDGVGPARLFATDAHDLAQTATGVGGAGEDAPRHVVLITDGVDGVSAAQFAGPGTTTTTLDISWLPEPPRRIEPGTVALSVREGELTVHVRHGAQTEARRIGPADQLALARAELLARELAPYRLPTGAAVTLDQDEEEIEAPVFEAPKDYPTMLGVGDPAVLDPTRTWKPRALPHRLRIPIGNGVDGQPVELDIKEAAMNGMGPHGLCIGATGSGKSEFLRTLVMGLAATHPPDQLNYVLVDFKGGATFAGLEALPHVSAVITNLEGELTLVDRMQDAIGGELDRRMEVLSQTNARLKNRDIKNREEYDAARRDGADIPPMPSLFIVVDEFSELLTARPEFIDLFIQIGRIGRSIGVHLLLASQRLEESKLRGLDTFLSYRIALRTFSPQESRTVIGVPDAYELPSAPGNGYLKYDTTNLVQFKAAYVSGPWKGSTAPVRPTAGTGLANAGAGLDDGLLATWIPPVLEFTPHYVPPVESPALPAAAVALDPAVPNRSLPAAPEPEPETDAEDETLLALVVDRLRGHGWPAHQVWLPPLDEPDTLDLLLTNQLGDGGQLVEVPGRGLTTADQRIHGRLRVTPALVDRPRQQRRDPLWLDLSGAAGHLGIAGGPQAGKSTALRSTVCGLALTHTPQEVAFYCLDFGGGALASLRDLPHVGSVCGRLDVDRVKRTVAELTSLLTAREIAFAEHGVESMAAYRRGRATGQIPADRFATDVFLVVDGWMTLRQEFDELEQTITQLAQRGLSFGIHVMAAAGKWSEFRLAIRDLFQSRLELKLGDHFESEINRKLAVNVPTGRPGRGLSPDGLHMMVALPRIDGSRDVETLPDGVRALVGRIRAAWPGPKAAEVRMLPDSLAPELLPRVAYDGVHRSWPLGVDELELAPVWYDAAAEQHLVTFGAPESGKSTVIRTMLQGIMARYRPNEAKVLLLDYRRSHLGLLPEEYLLGYCASSEAATETAKNVAAAVRSRLPGPKVTQEELRNRSWWKGIEVFVVVDDYELVATSLGNPLQPFFDLVSQANDIGLHIYLARAMGGAGRSGFSDQIIARSRDNQQPALILSGTRDEGALWGGVKPSPQPPGRGTLVTRAGNVLVQTVHSPDETA